MQGSARKPQGRAPASAVRQVRAVAVCRPPSAPEAEIEILPPTELPDDAADADLLRDVCAGQHTLRLPMYGHHGADASQLCAQEVAPLLDRLSAGESSAVIAYGQTGAGKSFTMGTERYEEGQGPAPHSVGAFCAQRVFALARQPGVSGLEVEFAAIEIYREGQSKERVFDLLTLQRKRIDSFHKEARWCPVASPDHLQRELLGASVVRNTDRTEGNARSSRSHAIFIIQVKLKRQQEGGGPLQKVKARLMLVDLAGSERAALAEAGSDTQKQGSGINVGLLYLGMVIKELAEAGSTLGYRNSLLTEILKPALGGAGNEVTGGCNTLMIGCISPLVRHLANTRSTLEFLQLAGTVRNTVRADVQTLSMLRQHELEKKVKDLEQQLRDFQLRQEQHDAAAASRESSPPPGVLAEASGDEGGAAMAAAAAADRAAELEREVAALRRELVEQRDRADAFEQLLQQQAAEAEAAADAAGAAAGSEAPAVQAAATPGAAGMPGASPAVGSTPAGGGRPSLAVLAASPLLAGSRAVGEYLADVAAAEAATPVGERLPLLQLLPGAEDICCQAESHMQADELRALKDKVERVLASASGADDRAQAKAFGEACLYAVSAYNQCLGGAITRLEDAAEDHRAELAERAAVFDQLYADKAMYMRRSAAAEGGLARYEAEIEGLKAELAAAHEALHQAQQQQGTPSRWAGTLGRLIGGSGGSREAPDSRRTSHSGSPASSPRASLPGGPQPQQLFGSPSRLGQLHSRGGAEGGDDRRATIACVRRSSGQEAAALAAAQAAALEGKLRRKSAAAVLCGEAAGEEACSGGLIAAEPPACVPRHQQQQQQQQEQQQQEEPGEGDVATPVGSPEVSCIASDGGSDADMAPAGPVEGPALPSPAGPAADAASDAAAPGAIEPEPPTQPAAPQAAAPEAASPAAAPEAAPLPSPQQEQPAQLPGPRISVTAPVGSGRGRRREAELEWEPASGLFYVPKSDEQADPLARMGLADGEPWQRRVLLKGSAIPLERWLQRRMLARGRCHFCCSEAPDPECAHPEAAFAALQLCQGCHILLEPDGWKSGEAWVAEDPEDPGFPWCCLCGGAGVGCTDALVMCSSCKLNGFCSGCIWRFTGDDLAAALNEGAQWECPLCRPEPKLRLAYAEDEEGRGAGGSSRGRAGKARSQPPEQQAAAAGVRRSGRQRQVPGTPAEFQCVVDLSSGSSGDEFEPEPEPTARRQPARAGAAKAAAPKAPAGGRKPAAAAAAGAATAGGADRTGGGAVAQQQQAVRKRTRMLLPQGDIVSSPGADGELPAHVHQKQRMRPQLAGLVSQQRQGLQASQQQANAKLKAMFSQMNL